MSDTRVTMRKVHQIRRDRAKKVNEIMALISKRSRALEKRLEAFRRQSRR